MDVDRSGASTFMEKVKDYCPSAGPSVSTGRIFVCFVLTSLFLAGAFGSCIMWFTDLYYDEVINQMTIREGSDVYEAWRKPPVQPLICVYVFNYTNIAEYKSGKHSKIRVEEIGPYCYRETLEKKNVTFNEDGTVTYGDTRKHQFEPAHSNGTKDDIVVVPNLALIGAVAMTKDLNRFAQFGISYFLRAVLHYSNTMLTVKAHDFLFGYDDRLVKVGMKLATLLQTNVPFEKFGILTARAADTDETITVRTGTNDVENIGIVTEMNGETELGVWEDPECDRIDGSDGAFFPRHTINENVTLYLFHKNMCRRMPFVYHKEVNFQGEVMAMRFHAAPDVYNTNGTCFCPPRGCAPNGVFDLSPCSAGMPLLVSFPHFLYADESISAPFEGLHPDPNKHEFYIDIQRLLGFTLGTVSRLQINVRVEKSRFATLIKEFPNDIILPVVWIQVSAEEMPPQLYNLIYHATFTVRRMQVVLMWGTLGSTLIILYFLLSNCHSLFTSVKLVLSKTEKNNAAQCQKMLPQKGDIQLCEMPVPKTIVA